MNHLFLRWLMMCAGAILVALLMGKPIDYDAIYWTGTTFFYVWICTKAHF